MRSKWWQMFWSQFQSVSDQAPHETGAGWNNGEKSSYKRTRPPMTKTILEQQARFWIGFRKRESQNILEYKCCWPRFSQLAWVSKPGPEWMEWNWGGEIKWRRHKGCVHCDGLLDRMIVAFYSSHDYTWITFDSTVLPFRLCLLFTCVVRHGCVSASQIWLSQLWRRPSPLLWPRNHWEIVELQCSVWAALLDWIDFYF